jgi:ATP adenylyltransferase
MEPCIGCDFANDVTAPPGGFLLRTERWMLNHCIGPLGLGTLVLAPVRHVVRVTELTDVELHEYARLMHSAATVIDAILGPEQTYVCLWSHGSEGPRHLHWIVQPVSDELVDLYGGKRSEELQLAMFEADAYPERSEIEAFCQEARGLLST